MMDLTLGGEVPTGERSQLHGGECVDGLAGTDALEKGEVSG